MKKIIVLVVALMMIISVQPAFGVEQEENVTVSSLDYSAYSDMLNEYAPVIWYSTLENIWPSSMEEMHECARVDDGLVTYTKAWKKLRGDFSRAKNYAFFCQSSENAMTLIYEQYYMTDPGKCMILHHYGDWEGCKIEFEKDGEDWEPVLFSFNHHGITEEVAWENSKLKKEGNHPIIYAARGSHGIYLSAGIHRYKSILLDSTNRGTRWSTCDCLESYYYDRTQAAGEGLVSIYGADHTNEFQTITRWGQSSNSPTGPLVQRDLQ